MKEKRNVNRDALVDEDVSYLWFRTQSLKRDPITKTAARSTDCHQAVFEVGCMYIISKFKLELYNKISEVLKRKQAYLILLYTYL